MSFHLDLEFAKDCAVWKEMLHHENLVEKQSVGALAGTYGRLPPSVLSHFLTHGHTHESLLPPREQDLLRQAQRDNRFSFDRNPSYALYDRASNLDRGALHALTRSAFARPSGRKNLSRVGAADEGSLEGQHPHTFLMQAHDPHAYPARLPTHAALGYLHGPDGQASARRNESLYPRAATTYAQGNYYASPIAAKAATADPHPALRQHPETSTYRRSTTGRRHHPFPRSAPRGGQGALPIDAAPSLAASGHAAQPQPQSQQQQNGFSEESKSNDDAASRRTAGQWAAPPASSWANRPPPPSHSAFPSQSPFARPGGAASAGAAQYVQPLVPRAPSAGSAAAPAPPAHALTARPATAAHAAHMSPPATSRVSSLAARYTGGPGLGPTMGSVSARTPHPPSAPQYQQQQQQQQNAFMRGAVAARPASQQAAPATASVTPARTPSPPPSAQQQQQQQQPSQLSSVTQPSVSHPSRAGFASHVAPETLAALNAASGGPAGAAARARGAIPAAESLLHTLPTAQAARAVHAFDHRAAFGSKGVFRVEARTKTDQGLHASHVSWQ